MELGFIRDVFVKWYLRLERWRGKRGK